MNIEQLRTLIREEVQRVVEDNIGGYNESPPTNTDHDDAPASLKDKLMQSPGAPFGGNLYQATGPIISNEARDSLHKWFRVAKAAWGKYGAPQNWPEEVSNLAIKLGQDFESKVGTKGPVQYR